MIQVIVQATSEATDSLLESCAAVRSMTTDVYTPHTGETIRIGEDMRNFTVALSDALMSSIKMSTVSLRRCLAIVYLLLGNDANNPIYLSTKTAKLLLSREESVNRQVLAFLSSNHYASLKDKMRTLL
jgi:hypothetical protein